MYACARAGRFLASSGTQSRYGKYPPRSLFPPSFSAMRGRRTRPPARTGGAATKARRWRNRGGAEFPRQGARQATTGGVAVDHSTSRAAPVAVMPGVAVRLRDAAGATTRQCRRSFATFAWTRSVAFVLYNVLIWAVNCDRAVTVLQFFGRVQGQRAVGRSAGPMRPFPGRGPGMGRPSPSVGNAEATPDLNEVGRPATVRVADFARYRRKVRGGRIPCRETDRRESRGRARAVLVPQFDHRMWTFGEGETS